MNEYTVLTQERESRSSSLRIDYSTLTYISRILRLAEERVFSQQYDLRSVNNMTYDSTRDGHN